MIEVGKCFDAEKGELIIRKFLGKGKSGYSYLCRLNDEQVILKLMHDEKSPYYHFTSDKTSVEIEAYKKLKKLKLNIPELLEYNIEKQYLIKEYIDGFTAAELIAYNRINGRIIEQLFYMSRKTQKAKINIDYFPTNFVIKNDELYYIDYEINPYSEDWNLENWGIYYWANSKGFGEFLKTNNAVSINRDIEKGIPFKIPFEEQVIEWIDLYSN